MKQQTYRLLWGTCGLLTLAGAADWAGAQSPPTTTQAAPGATAPSADQAGYSYGVNFGEQLYRLGITTEIPMDSLVRGMKDGLAGKKTTSGDIQVVTQYVKTLNDAAFARNQSAAKEFLGRNAGQKGVKTTPSGLQYKILAAGNSKAAAPHATDIVTVQYRGKLLDGTEFDSSYSRGQPASFVVSNVVKGWQEALVMMKPGAKWQLFVPPELAYGDARKPGIAPGSLLIFDVELISTTPATVAK